MEEKKKPVRGEIILTAEEKERGMTPARVMKAGGVKGIKQMAMRSTPIEGIKGTDDFVKWGDDNLYFNFLADIYYGSPSNNACIKGTARAIFGRGLYPVNKSARPEVYVKFASAVNQTEVSRICFEKKLYGMASLVIRKNALGELNEIGYWPMHTLRIGKCNEKGEITQVWYCVDWSDPKKVKEAKAMWVFGYEPEGVFETIKIIKDFSPGMFYYSPPDYEGGTDWAKLEINTGKFYSKYVENGLYPGFMINFNNGVPSEAEQDEIEMKIKGKYSLEGAGGPIISFNDGKEAQSTIEAIPLPEASSQFEFLSKESGQKIMLAHTITSPMLLGIKDNTGLGNNADELKTAYWLFMETVVQPIREEIIRAFEEVLTEFSIYTPLAFENTLNPAEISLRAQGINHSLSEVKNQPKEGEMTQEDESVWMGYLDGVGEEINEDEWEEVAAIRVDDPSAEEKLISEFLKAPNASYEKPQGKSDGDSGLYKVRYRYAPASATKESRTFCKYMTTRRKNGAVYALENIINMGSDGVNSQFSPKGESTYSIWEWKGGVYCHHYWERVVYFRKRNPDGSFKTRSGSKEMENDRVVGTGDAGVQRAIDAGVPREVLNPPGIGMAGTKPIDTPTRGKLN